MNHDNITITLLYKINESRKKIFKIRENLNKLMQLIYYIISEYIIKTNIKTNYIKINALTYKLVTELQTHNKLLYQMIILI